MSVLPPALKCLVHLWEEVTASCLQTITQHVFVSPGRGKGKGKDRAEVREKEKGGTMQKKGKKSRRKQVVPRKYLGV